MLDIFGFWAAVTMLTIGMTAFPIAIFFVISSIFVAKSIPNEEDSETFRRWFFYHDFRRDEFCFFNARVKIHEFSGPSIGVIATVMSWMIVGAAIPEKEVETIVDAISLSAKALSSAASFIGLALAALLAIRIAVRYGYYALKFKEKVSAHMGNKEIHK